MREEKKPGVGSGSEQNREQNKKDEKKKSLDKKQKKDKLGKEYIKDD